MCSLANERLGAPNDELVRTGWGDALCMDGGRMGLKRWLMRGRSRKVFGIGLIKTGTTSLGKALELLGYDHTNENREYLLRCTQERHLRPVLHWVDNHDSFEDWPWPLLYEELDRHYPNSRFILTLRLDEERWLKSVKRHSEWVGPSLGRRLFFGHDTPDGHEGAYLDAYRRHVDNIRQHFAGTGRLLEVCWERGDGWRELANFLGHPTPKVPFPQLNTAAARIWK